MTGRLYNKVVKDKMEMEQKSGKFKRNAGSPSRAKAILTDKGIPTDNKGEETVGRQKRKKDSTGEEERERRRSLSDKGDIKGKYTEEEYDSEESENNLEEMIVDAVAKEEQEWKEEMERTVEEESTTDIRRMLKQVMFDFRNQTKQLEKENERIRKQENKEIKVDWDLKKYMDESNEKWRKKVDEELDKVNAKLGAVKKQVEEIKEKGTQDPEMEALKKDVEELKRWRKEVKRLGDNLE